MCTAHDVLHKG